MRMFSFNPCSVIKLGQTGVYLVDNLNSAEGLPCTCTIYWLYRNVQVTERGLSEYVPKCATNQSMIRDELDKCADLLGNPVETHCRRTSSGNHELTTIATSGLTFSGTTEQKLTNLCLSIIKTVSIFNREDSPLISRDYILSDFRYLY